MEAKHSKDGKKWPERWGSELFVCYSRSQGHLKVKVNWKSRSIERQGQLKDKVIWKSRSIERQGHLKVNVLKGSIGQVEEQVVFLSRKDDVVVM